MIDEYKKAILDHMERNPGFEIIWAAGKMPCEFLNEKVELIYENMDGQPEVCNAIYTYNKNDKFYHRPYFQRESDGIKMCNCIAWRERK